MARRILACCQRESIHALGLSVRENPWLKILGEIRREWKCFLPLEFREDRAMMELYVVLRSEESVVGGDKAFSSQIGAVMCPTSP